MKLWFKPLLSLEVRHAYYGGVCPELGFVVPKDVAHTLRGAGLRAQIIGGVFQVFYAASDDGSPVVSSAGRTLRIGLKARAAHFSTITEELDTTPGTLYYRNAVAERELDQPTRVSLIGATFSKALAREARPVSLNFKNSAGDTVRSDVATAQNGRTVASFDLTGLAPGVFDFEEVYAESTLHSPNYVDPELLREDVFGVVDLVVHDDFHSSPPVFSVSFRARLEALRYYVVAKGFSTPDVEQLSVKDHGFGEPDRPDEVKFAKVPPAELSADEKVRIALLGADGASVVLFKSSAAVARRDRARKRIQLMRNGEPLIENLPQPGKDRATADLIVHVSKSQP